MRTDQRLRAASVDVMGFMVLGSLLLTGCASLGFGNPPEKSSESAAKPDEATDDRETADEKDEPESYFNLPWKTGGGNQVWSDILVYSSWRIQHNVVTGHYRLIDPKDVRRAWGDLEQCRAKFDQLKREEKIAPPDGKCVVVLHGLWRKRHAMQTLCDHLAEKGGYHIVNVSYATTRASIGDHAKTLAMVIEGLDGVDEISFVGNSLGNLVIRRYLHDQTTEGRPLDPRIKRFVMLAPPNQGAQVARRFEVDAALKSIWGVPGNEIAEWTKLAPTLATPTCEFAIISGGQGKDGRNPLIPGDDDWLLSVEETKLEGAKEFLLLPVTHRSIKSDPTTLEQTLCFLKDGCFKKAE